MEVERNELRRAVEQAFSCHAAFVFAERVTEVFRGRTAWEGIVHVFRVAGKSEATLAYAWLSPIEGRSTRRFYTVLGKPPINSARDAVRAAIVAESRE